MRELSTPDLVTRIVEIATGERYGDGDIVTDVATGYAEPGYGSDDAIIVLGNWNDKRPTFGWNVKNLDGERFPYTSAPPTTKAHTIPSRLARVLESAGAEIEWCDEWVRCGECYRIFRSQPDSYSWRMFGAYVEEAADYFCADCLKSDPESTVADYVNDAHRCLTVLDGSDLEGIGFQQWKPGDPQTYENGWHEGMDANPETVMAEIHEAHEDAEVVFVLTEQSQFYIGFAAYFRTPEQDECPGHESTSGPIGNVVYCDGTCQTDN